MNGKENRFVIYLGARNNKRNLGRLLLTIVEVVILKRVLVAAQTFLTLEKMLLYVVLLQRQEMCLPPFSRWC